MEAPLVTTQSDFSASKSLNYTTRFGEVQLDENNLISFPVGILGFDNCTVFGLSRLPNSENSPVLLLQCVNEPEIAFLVADPSLIGLEIKQADKDQAIQETGMNKESTQFLSILTLYEQEDSHYLTANLRAPLMIDANKRTARQHILTNKAYTTQHKI